MIHILIAEDDEDDQVLIWQAFNEILPHCRLSIADNGVGLLEQLRALTDLPALIILDVNMPLKDGFDTLTELRQSTQYGGVPIIMLSTASNGRFISRSYRAGANAYLLKPTGYAELRELIKGMHLVWLTTYSMS